MGFRVIRFAIAGVFLVVGLVLWFHGDRLLGGVVALMSLVRILMLAGGGFGGRRLNQ